MRKEISVGIFSCNKTKTELDDIVAEVLASPGYQLERRRTMGQRSATFLYYEEELEGNCPSRHGEYVAPVRH